MPLTNRHHDHETREPRSAALQSTPVSPTNNVSAEKPLNDAERRAAFARELKVWRDRKTFDRVKLTPTDRRFANVVGSYTAYRRKTDGSVKAQIVPWGHHEQYEGYLRVDAPSMSLEVFRWVLFTDGEMGWQIGQMDIKAAYLQAKGFSRTIYVRPSREAGEDGIPWKLLTTAYRLTDSRML